MERRVYSDVIEGLMAGIKGRVTPGLAQELKRFGLEEGARLPATLLPTQWNEVLQATAKHVYPAEPESMGLRRLGLDAMVGMQSSMLMKAAFALSKLVGPAKALERATKGRGNGQNYAKLSIAVLEAGRAVLHVQPIDVFPEFVLGCFLGTVLASGGKDPRGSVKAHDAAREFAELELFWSV